MRHERRREMHNRLRDTEHRPNEEHITRDPLGRLLRRTTPAPRRRGGRNVGALGVSSGREGDRHRWNGRLASEEGEPSGCGWEWCEGGLRVAREGGLLACFGADGADDVDPVEPFFQVDRVWHTHRRVSQAPCYRDQGVP